MWYMYEYTKHNFELESGHLQNELFHEWDLSDSDTLHASWLTVNKIDT